MQAKSVFSVSFCLALLAVPMSGETLTHDYNLKSSLNDLVGSTALNADGGSISATGYAFDANQGLNVSSVLPDVGTYSILMDFSFADLDGYRKILDFKDQTSDNGLYNLSTDVNYFNFSFSPDGVLAADTPARVVITRDATTNLVVGYVDGVQQISFTDPTADATFTGTNGIMRFFEDDTVTGLNEASAGVATQIAIYSDTLTADQVAQLGGPGGVAAATPEPASVVLLGMGLAAFAVFARRRGFTS